MDYETAKEKAVRYSVLALRTEEEVKNKLRKLNVEEGIIVQVTEYLKSIGYIDDEKYVEAYIRQCINIPKYSKYEIRMKLIQKGINKEILSEKLEELDNCDYENKLISNYPNATKLILDDGVVYVVARTAPKLRVIQFDLYQNNKTAKTKKDKLHDKDINDEEKSAPENLTEDIYTNFEYVAARQKESEQNGKEETV